MDPITHGSIAVLAAVALVPAAAMGARVRGAIVLGTAALAGNIPDCDSYWPHFPEDTGGLGYMLYHRGATHTVLGSLALGVLFSAVVWLLCHLVRAEQRPTFRELSLISVVGCQLHWVFDGFVDYGVHPFWPYAGWFYGDFLFLAEPLLWVALLPSVASWIATVAFRTPQHRRLLAFGLPLLAVLWTWIQTGALKDWPLPGPLREVWIVPGAALFVTVCMIAGVAALRRWSELNVATASLMLVLVAFFGASRLAKAEAARHLAAVAAPGERVAHVVTTATAGNPLCWRVVTSSHAEHGSKVVVRMASFSLLPALTDARSCVISNRHAPPSGAISDWNEEPKDEDWNWFGEFQGQVKDFDELAKNCRVAATKQFLRAPFWVTSGDRVLVGDLRLDYFPEPTRWAKYTFTKGEKWTCDSLEVPPWTPPFFE